MDWRIRIDYNGRSHELEAEKIYESSQLMKIKVHGKHGFIILENDYPFINSTNSKKAMKWKLRDEGALDIKKQEDAALIARIITALEYLVKGKPNSLYANVEYLGKKKGY